MLNATPQTRLSRMSDHAASLLLEGEGPVGDLPLLLAQGWPDAPSLEIGLAIASACDAIEQMCVPQPTVIARVLQGWRVAALVGGDVLALQMLGRPHALAHDLLTWWAEAKD